MRHLDEFARLWNDTCARLPRSAWSWPLLAAIGGAAVFLVSAGQSEVTTVSNVVAEETNEKSPACEEQTWPYLSDACLQRDRAAAPVRVLNYDAAMARAAIGATPWAPKETTRPPQARPQPPGRRQAAQERNQERDRTRTVTVRSGRRNAEPGRVYHVPRDAYSAYGYAPRRH